MTTTLLKLYQPVWVALPDSSAPAIGVVLKPGQYGCIVAVPESNTSRAAWVAPSDALAPATAAEIEVAPEWLRQALQTLVVNRELMAQQEVAE
jgi:hypothetical protein